MIQNSSTALELCSAFRYRQNTRMPKSHRGRPFGSEIYTNPRTGIWNSHSVRTLGSRVHTKPRCHNRGAARVKYISVLQAFTKMVSGQFALFRVRCFVRYQSAENIRLFKPTTIIQVKLLSCRHH